MKARVVVPGMVLLVVLSVPAAAQTTSSAGDLVSKAMAHEPDRERGAALYRQHCAECHGERAEGEGAEAIPALAGQREYYLLTQLVDIAILERSSPDMHRVLRGPGLDQPEQWRDITAHLAGLAPNPNPQHGDGRALQTGERLYGRACAQCHGEYGEGSSKEPIPAVRAQHYPYLVQQLNNFAAGHRTQVEPPILDFAAGLTPEEISSVADYMSRLPADRPK